MNPRKALVLDANILIRAVFGVRVFAILESHEDSAEFYSPSECFEEATRNVSRIANFRDHDVAISLAALARIASLVESVDRILYEEFELPARARISARDPDDWPIVATALMLNAPIWTEDRDFFGVGIATWTTDRVEIYLRDS
jgi:predicted nucleic acid-binding protein